MLVLKVVILKFYKIYSKRYWSDIHPEEDRQEHYEEISGILEDKKKFFFKIKFDRNYT